jgi:hypothetical protein
MAPSEDGVVTITVALPAVAIWALVTDAVSRLALL